MMNDIMNFPYAPFLILFIVLSACIAPALILNYRDSKKAKRIEKEGKYVKTLHCSNCGEYHYFEVLKGTCMIDFLKEQKCTKCNCELKEAIKN